MGALEHFWLTMGYVGFFVVHIAQVIRAGWANFRAMVCGYDLASPGAADRITNAEINAEGVHGD
jgi:hypothetical protein